MKRAVTLLAMVLAVVLLAGNAFAADTLSPVDYYAVSGFGETEEKSSFSLNETPFLYYSFSVDSLGDVFGDVEVTSILSIQGPKGYAIPDFSVNEWSVSSEGYYEYWIEIDDWDDIGSYGDWSVDTRWYNFGVGQVGIGNGTAGFSVTPEPVSMLLMGVGGFALFYRRKK